MNTKNAGGEVLRVGRYLIYGLLDPRDGCLRYIGKTHKRREWRLAEHIVHASEGDTRPVYNWIRTLLEAGVVPEIFVWRRIHAHDDWRRAEKDAIAFWSAPERLKFPYVHPPQTPKSSDVVIHNVHLENVTAGG